MDRLQLLIFFVLIQMLSVTSYGPVVNNKKHKKKTQSKQSNNAPGGSDLKRRKLCLLQDGPRLFMFFFKL